MLFETVLFNRYEFMINHRIDPSFQRLLNELADNNIHQVFLEHFNLETVSADVFLSRHKIRPENCLVFASTDQTLQFFSNVNVAVLGFLNGEYPDESLNLADILVEGFDEVDLLYLERVYMRNHKMPWTIAETKRCVIREMTLDDLDEMYEIYKDEKIRHFIENLYEDREEEEAYTKTYIENMYGFYGYGMWIVNDKETGKIIGRAGLDLSDASEDVRLEMGYLIREEYRNQGYATEACKEVIHFAAEETYFEELYCFIMEENEASIRFSLKLGFIYDGEEVIDGKTMQRYRKTLHF